jgi:hypothetical protein
MSRTSAAIALLCAVATTGLLSAPAPAAASSTQFAMIEDGPVLMADPAGTLQRFRLLGATAVRVFVFWSSVTKNPNARKQPSHFNAADPNAYPAANWATYDTIVRDAKQDGITIDFTVSGGAPRWADGPGMPSGTNLHYAWYPSVRDFSQFVHAVGQRYSGNFTPRGQSSRLPSVHLWALWNEPNFGEDLGPQAINGSSVSVAPAMYRNLAQAGWSALRATGHARDTILIGELAARGLSGPPSHGAPQGFPGNFSQTKPLQFVRTLYCVDSSYNQLRGAYAAARGCPTTAASSRRFRAQYPVLFSAGGFSDHPYPGNRSPVTDAQTDPDFATFPDLPNLERVLDRVNRIYGSGTRFQIYNDEYGYITDPPAKQRAEGGGHYVSPATAAYYINWAEYLSWRSGRIKSTMQYLLSDVPGNDGFSSGLLSASGAQKPGYSAYRLPLYLPVTSTHHGRSLEVWGDVRPAHFAQLDTRAIQTAQIQFQRGSHGAFKTLGTLKIRSAPGYFDVHMTFPASGTVRLTWTYPKTDPFLPVSALGATVYSRHVQITVQ